VPGILVADVLMLATAYMHNRGVASPPPPAEITLAIESMSESKFSRPGNFLTCNPSSVSLFTHSQRWKEQGIGVLAPCGTRAERMPGTTAAALKAATLQADG
jgi:hypothetical protein